jgi:hypothetical protein
MVSNVGCDTPNVTRCSWFSLISAYPENISVNLGRKNKGLTDSADNSSARDSSGSARALRASSVMLWIDFRIPSTRSGSWNPQIQRKKS